MDIVYFRMEVRLSFLEEKTLFNVIKCQNNGLRIEECKNEEVEETRVKERNTGSITVKIPFMMTIFLEFLRILRI